MDTRALLDADGIPKADLGPYLYGTPDRGSLVLAVKDSTFATTSGVTCPGEVSCAALPRDSRLGVAPMWVLNRKCTAVTDCIRSYTKERTRLVVHHSDVSEMHTSYGSVQIVVSFRSNANGRPAASS